MYQAQSKRIFPRKDEIYRTDIPSHNNYYSSSSVYSYSPTSSTDCPEHGRSRRKLTLILTVSIVLVTLGVLSIAGIAAYLGIISKNSSSQYEEINLLGNTNKLDRKNDYIITNGRSRSDPSIHSQSQFDFTNSIVETKSPHQDHVVNEDDLTQSVVSNTVRYPQRPSTSAVITARPTSTSNSNNQNDRRHNQRFPFPPTTTTPPSTFPIETSTETRRRESATPEAPIIIRAPPTQPPPLKSHDRYHYRNRHRHRYPPTNSHSLPPSSSTTLETTVSESKDRDDEEPPKDSSTINSKPNSSNSQNRDTIAGNLDRGQESEESDKTETDEPTAINIKKNEPSQDDYEIENAKDKKQDENLFGAHHPTPSSNTYQTEELAGGQSNSEDEEDMTKYHEYNPNRPPPPRPEQGSIDRNYDPDMTNHRVITSQGSKFFIPVNPLYKPMVYQQQQQQQRPQPNLAIENHKQQNINTESPQHPVHLTFDRIAPEFYDKKPWTPLLNRPNLDKRPRVELLTHPTDIPSHPEERTTQIADYSETVGHDHDHFYDRTGDALSSSIGSNEPIRHAPTEPINSDEAHDGDANGSSSTEEVSAEVAQGVKPPDIQAFTLYIPHIDRPNPILQSNLSLSLTKDPVHSEDNSPAANERRDDLNTTSPTTSTTNGHISDFEATPHNAHSSQAGDMHNNNDHHDKIGGEVMDDLRKISEENRDKDEDYFDGEDDITGGDDPPQTKIYKLDADNVDIVPDTLATAKPLPPVRELRREDTQESSALPSPQMPKDMSSPVDEESGELFEKVHTITHDENSSPELPSVSTKTTNSDPIMSTLGSLNLMKTSGMPQHVEPEDAPSENNPQENTETDAKVQLSPSEENKENSNQSSQNGTESPLFPPVRSYVGINQPLRPKPDGESSEEGLGTANDFPFLDNKDESDEKTVKQVRVYKENEDQLPNFTFTTTSSLNKVLSMMMNFENDKNKLTSPALTNISSQNVHLVVADNGKAIVIKNGDNANNSNTNATSSTISNNREPKLFNRDPKIDSRFSDPAESVAHVPVPLLNNDRYNSSGLTKPSNNNNKPNTTTTKISSVTMGANSPVYKFILRKGQSVEDLLKEIFQNYTEKSATTKGTHVGIGVPSLPVDGVTTKMTALQRDDIEMEEVTTATTIRSQETPSTSSATTARNPVSAGFFHSSSFNSLGSTVPSHLKSTTLDPQVKTSTSIVVNGNFEPCPTNNSFRCTSNGKCISGFGRCNGIRDCPDNSDEKGCLCVDHLRAQMLHRKICDGVPDCKDFSDEYQCDWCSPGQYICAGSRACVNRDKICDGKRDCPRGDDENECVKIGSSDTRDELEDLSPTYHRSGHLMVRKKGVWGKLCVETFSTVVSHWEVKDLARAVCKALTFSDFETVERVEDDKKSATEPYYELYYGTNETVDSDEGNSGYASSESTPRSSLGFKQTQCKSRLVVKVTCQDLQCGTAPRAFTQAARIVGGANALPGEWPWQAALYRDGEYQCGATLISSRWLLSAGHCFYHAQDDHWVARLGTLRRGATVLSPYEQVVKITHVFLHPQYKDVGFVNDVSLLRLEHEVNFTDFVRPVCLPGRDTRIRDGRMCTVVGWGQLFEVGRVFPDTLQEVQLPLISTAECRKRTLFLPLYKLTDEMFCAGFDRGGRDACLGDSGGPLMCSESDGRWSLYGVTSNGYGCARANRPGVYTKVARYLDWIYDKMSQDSTYTYRDKAKPCNGHRCPLGECLEPRRLCNGFSDCLDGSDERNCTWS